MIHSADARAQSAHAAVWVALLPVVRSRMTRVNLPFAYLTEESIVSPGRTVNTFTDGAGNSSYHAWYCGVVPFWPPQWASVPSCSTVPVVKPSRPAQLEVHWFRLP